ncbi:TPA: restriction endonuclease subunit S [Streptococcus suis]|nr:restriction endonuclease subunit S [Streptococcus suis]
MKTNNNIPAYRFQGYTDAWELRKLGEVAEINPKSQIPETFEYVDLESVVGTSLISHRTVRAEYAPSRAQRLALPGDIFYQTVRPYQKNNYLFDLSDDNYVFSTGYAQLRPKIDDRYLMIKIQEDGFVKEVLDRCTGTSYPAINSKDLSQISIDVPTSLPEQEAIGTFFSTLDRHIPLHQRKLDTLKEQKKTYLKLLFPAKGQTKPALRFQGFEDDWEEVKLGEVLVEYNKKSEIENQFELLSSTNSGIEPRSGRVSGESNIGYKIIKRGMVVLSPQNLWLGNINYNAKFEIGIVSPSYKVFNINGPNELYLATVLRLPKMFFEYAQASVQGASIVRRNLDLDLFSSILVQLPSLPEQEVIGTFFQNLDQEIAQVEDKLASLKEMKKTLLRKLFV